MINERGLLKILKATHRKSGYMVIPVTTREDTPAGPWRRNEFIINGPTWALRCDAEDLPQKVSVQIAEDVGYLPMEPVKVQKGEPNQMVTEVQAETARNVLIAKGAAAIPMLRIPIIFKDRWQLFQTNTGLVAAFDTELLAMLGQEEKKPTYYITEDGLLGVFSCVDGTAYIAPGWFSGADLDKIRYIAGRDWENQIETEDPVANYSLFDGDKEEDLMEQGD